MKSLKILLIAILLAGSLTAESIITLTRYDTTTQKGSEEFANSLKMVLDNTFKSAVLKQIEKKTSARLHEDFRQYIDIKFSPYRSAITAKGKGEHAALIETAFAETFINYRQNAKVEKSMKPVEAARIDLARIREQLSGENLDSNQKSDLQHDLEVKSKELKQLMSSVTSKELPLWQYTMSQPVGI